MARAATAQLNENGNPRWLTGLPPENEPILAASFEAQKSGRDTAIRLREICGQVFRYVIATGRATYNPAADLVGAIVPAKVQHRPARIKSRDPALMRVRCRGERAAA